ncbi:MAG: YIP1 family protein [Treponema sp.]
MKKRVYLFVCILTAALLCAFSPLAAQELGSGNYIYSPYTEVVKVPPAYMHSRSVTARDFDRAGLFEQMIDAFVSPSSVYVLCKNRLIKLRYDFTLEEVLTGYTGEDGSIVPFDECSGIFVAEDGSYYISQAELSQILHFNADHSLRRILSRPQIQGFEDIAYRPTKLTGDSTGRLYVIAKGMYEGIVELNPDGSFTRFYGVHKTDFNPVNLFWRRFATKEQRKRQKLWLPSDFSNLCMDSEGLIFATEQGQEASITRLNAAGSRILKVPRNQPFPQGDVNYNTFGRGIPTGPSQLISIDAGPSGMYIALDMVRSRVFAYNEDHRLLFVFGGKGDRAGYFSNPIDACFAGRNIFVLDSLAQSIEVFEPTQYGHAIHSALELQRNYQYDEAMEAWRTALKYNHQFTLAYSGIGRCLIRQKKYAEALDYLQRGDDRIYYSKAFEKVRNQKLRAAFPSLLWTVIILGLVKLCFVLARLTGISAAVMNTSAIAPVKPLYAAVSSRLQKPLFVFWFFPWRILASPFKGFDEMKYEKKGSYAFGFFILCLSALINIMDAVYSGFLINFTNPYLISSIFLASVVVFAVVLFVTGNWSITTLLDGKGKYGEIFLTVMYALFPVCLLRLLAILLSNVLTLEEMPIAFALLSIATAVFILYLFIGLAVIHQYSFSKGLVSLLLTIVAMAIITFILMLMFSLGSDVVEFFYTVSRELMLKYF